MNELANTIKATGTYNNIPTTLTSNTSVVNLIEGLTLQKEADKQNWLDGLLTYTITLTNSTENDYKDTQLIDTINTSLVAFVPASVTINNVSATEKQYKYEEENQTLTIQLDTVTASSEIKVTFKVKKKDT